ncbi:hypothetical protein L596_016216 [Steinernema carpocapsae]|uniref:RING-CH-type domain-containing protein n=1 Tax=Steinernema carpocapsae TaxID=34508 RepID=A0A4U5NHB1_STECR|nr:hypothetical protein L596_016216 [Steinernema carpocapsae]
MSLTLSTSSEASVDSLPCRICQSAKGKMVRPCACSGSVANVHEICLNKWVARSNRKICEICHQEYATSGRCLLPFWKWSIPNIKPCHIVQFFIIFCLSVTFFISLYFVCFTNSYDREVHLFRMVICLFGVIFFTRRFFVRFWKYMRKQKVVHFVDAKLEEGKPQQQNDVQQPPVDIVV